MSGVRGQRQRPWRTLRCVVEVKVPPGNRSTEKDVAYHVKEALEDYWAGAGEMQGTLPLPRAMHANHYLAKPRVKAWTPVFRYVVNHLPESIRRHIALSY